MVLFCENLPLMRKLTWSRTCFTWLETPLGSLNHRNTGRGGLGERGADKSWPGIIWESSGERPWMGKVETGQSHCTYKGNHQDESIGVLSLDFLSFPLAQRILAFYSMLNWASRKDNGTRPRYLHLHRQTALHMPCKRSAICCTTW